MDIGTGKQLFLDDRLVDESVGLDAIVHPPVKRGPVVLPELPSELGRIGFYGSVLDLDGVARMWYWAQTPRMSGEWERGLALAESTDGVHWVKPCLGLQERVGSRANNLVDSFGDTVSLNPEGPAEERFVLLQPMYRAEPARGGLYVSFSADGTQWHHRPTNLFPFVPDTQNQLLYDTSLRTWVAYVRAWDPDRCVGRVEADSLLSAWSYRSGVPPNRIWGDGYAAVPSCEIPVVLRASEGVDGPDADVYTPVVVQYPWADATYLMFPSIYQHYPPPSPDCSPHLRLWVTGRP